MDNLRIVVKGIPAPQGSKTGYPITRKDGTRGVAMVESAGQKLKTWRETVTAYTIQAVRRAKWEARKQAVAVHIRFYLPRPQGHWGTGRNEGTMRPSAPTYPITKPDIDKLERAVLDALTKAKALTDDAIVVATTVWKLYADGREPGTFIQIDYLEDK